MGGLARPAAVAVSALVLAAVVTLLEPGAPRHAPSAPTASFQNAQLVTWRGSRRLAAGSAASLLLSRDDGRFSSSVADLELGEAVRIHVGQSTGRLVPPSAEFDRFVASTDASFAETEALRYDDDAVLRSKKSVRAQALVDGHAVGYQAGHVEWDPVSGKILMTSVETIYARDGGVILSIRAERASMDDLWQRASYRNATFTVGSNARWCERLTVDRPHEPERILEALRCE